MEKFQAFLKRKDIIFSAKRHFIDAMEAYQGLFARCWWEPFSTPSASSSTSGSWNAVIVTIGKGDGSVNPHHRRAVLGHESTRYGRGHRPRERAAAGAVLTDPRGFHNNSHGRRGRSLAVLFVAIAAAELGKAVSKETKIDILVTPIVTVLVGRGFRRADRRAGGHGAASAGTGH